MSTPSDPSPVFSSAPSGHPPPQQPDSPATSSRPGYLRALIATLIWTLVNLVATLLVPGPPPSAYAAGRLTGALLFPTVLAALLTWLVARRARRVQGWPFWLLTVLALPIYLLLRIVTGWR